MTTRIATTTKPGPPLFVVDSSNEAVFQTNKKVIPPLIPLLYPPPEKTIPARKIKR
jgi:hypothetical protein